MHLWHGIAGDNDGARDDPAGYGSAANPFRVYPLTIVLLSWLRGAKAERLLHEVIEGDGGKRPFDLLILDEAHHVAPAAPKQRYAVDCQLTKPIRWLNPHFDHRLFLSATPDNGYPESFTALATDATARSAYMTAVPALCRRGCTQTTRWPWGSFSA